MTVSSSLGSLVHLFLCLVSKSSSTDQGEALEALLLPLQGQQGSLERAVELDQTVAMVMDYDPNSRGAPHANRINVRLELGLQSHICAIAYLCD
jgi:hypothetical protein